MAKLIFEESGKELEARDNSPIKDTCQEADVLFGCEDGYCGSCRIQIKEGENNFEEKNRNEKDLTGSDPKLRLACQCKIKSGIIKISNY